MPVVAEANPKSQPRPVSSGRDLRFDSVRGLMLVTMTINHLPSAARVLTDGALGIFSSAEGFVFISGLLAGWVYTRRRRRDGPDGLRHAVNRRATMIYAWHLAAFMSCLALIHILSWLSGFCSWTSPPLFYAHPFLAALLGSAMLYQPGLLDILPMYCFFVLLLRPVLAELEAGRRWRVLGLSGLAWLLTQWVPPVDGAPLYPVHVGSFNIFAWQFLFVAGAVIGHERASPGFAPLRFRPLLFLGAFAVAAYGFGIQRLGWRPPCSDALFGVLLNKPNLGFLRLANFGMIAYLVGLVGAYFPRLLTWRPLAFIGQHSLVVFAAQSVAVSVVIQFDPLFSTPLRDGVTTTAAVLFLFLCASLHEAYTRHRAAAKLQARPGSALGVKSRA